MSRPHSVAIAALAALLTLSGCVDASPAPSPAGAPAAPETQPATPEPVDPLSTVTSLVATPEALELRNGSGAVVTTFSYLSAPAEALDALTTVFGAAPADEEFDGSSHVPPSTVHRWEGFELWEQRYVDRWEDSERSLARPEFVVRIVAAEALGADLSSPDGRQVGDAWADLTAEPELRTVSSGCSGPYLDFVEVEDVHSHVSGEAMKVSVEFDPSADGSAIASITAPMPVFESACA